MSTDLRALVAEMRSDGPRYRARSGDANEVINAQHADDWADQLEAALDAAEGVTDGIRDVQKVSPVTVGHDSALHGLRDTFSRWSRNGQTDYQETPINDYGKRVLSMVIRALDAAPKLRCPQVESGMQCKRPNEHDGGHHYEHGHPFGTHIEAAEEREVSDAVGEPVMSASRLKREAIQRAAQPVPDLAPSVDCPLCGVTVEQVSSATLSLALSQHVRWACPKQPPDLAQIRAEVEALPRFAVAGDRRGQMYQFDHGEFLYREHVLAILDRHLGGKP